MSTKPAWLDRAAQRMIESDGADYGDERERTVAMEGQAFGMQLAVWVCWLGALLMALTGQLEEEQRAGSLGASGSCAAAVLRGHASELR